VSEQVPWSVRLTLRPIVIKKTPQESEPKDQADRTKRILMFRDAGIHKFPAIAVRPPQVWVVLNEQHGDGQQQETGARDEAFECPNLVGLGHHDQDHH
jgi:hypothetical protein